MHKFFLTKILIIGLCFPIFAESDLENERFLIEKNCDNIFREKIQKTIDALNEDLKIYPNNVEKLVELASIHASLMQTEEAISYYQKALSIDPQNIEILRALGISYRISGEANKAIVYFRKGLEVDSINIDMLMGIGMCYESMGQFVKAKSYYLKAKKVYKQNGKVEEIRALEEITKYLDEKIKGSTE